MQSLELAGEATITLFKLLAWHTPYDDFSLGLMLHMKRLDAVLELGYSCHGRWWKGRDTELMEEAKRRSKKAADLASSVPSEPRSATKAPGAKPQTRNTRPLQRPTNAGLPVPQAHRAQPAIADAPPAYDLGDAVVARRLLIDGEDAQPVGPQDDDDLPGEDHCGLGDGFLEDWEATLDVAPANHVGKAIAALIWIHPASRECKRLC